MQHIIFESTPDFSCVLEDLALLLKSIDNHVTLSQQIEPTGILVVRLDSPFLSNYFAIYADIIRHKYIFKEYLYYEY